MKILEKGNWFDPWSAILKCKTCEAVLEVDEKDVRPWRRSGGYCFTCPQCKKEAQFDGNILSPRIREKCDAQRYHL